MDRICDRISEPLIHKFVMTVTAFAEIPAARYMNHFVQNKTIVDKLHGIWFYRSRAFGHPSLYCFAILTSLYTHIVNSNCRHGTLRLPVGGTVCHGGTLYEKTEARYEFQSI